MKLLLIVAALVAIPAVASGDKFMPGELELIQLQVDSHAAQIESNTRRIDQLEDRLFSRLDEWIASNEPKPEVQWPKTPEMPERLVSAPVRKAVATTAAVVAAPVRMVRRKVCQNGICTYVMVPETVAASKLVATAAPVPVATPYHAAVRSVQCAGCSGGSCSYRSRTVYRRGLLGRLFGR